MGYVMISIQIQIYNKDLSTTAVEQLPATTFVEVVGTVGGLLGLWLGASMLSILEFCELLANLSVVSCSSLKRGIGCKARVKDADVKA